MRRWQLFLELLLHHTPVYVLLYSSFLWGTLWEAAFDGVPFFPNGFWNAKDRIVLGNISRPFGFSSYVLKHFSPQRGPWAQHKVGLGRQVLWPHIIYYIYIKLILVGGTEEMLLYNWFFFFKIIKYIIYI